MRVYLETLGCRLNYAEMAALGRQLEGAGHNVVASATEAEVCVLNTCAVTGEAARKSRQVVRQLARTNPGLHLVVTGCYASLESEMVASLPNVTLVVGNDRKEALLSLLEEAVGEAGAARPASPAMEIPLLGVEPSPAPAHGDSTYFFPAARTRAFVKVQDGCHNRCTFCIVTVARGQERSRPIAQVLSEVNRLHAAGYQEAVLTGVHLGAYGRDLGSSLLELVDTLLSGTTLPRLRLSSLEPFDLAPQFFDLWAQSQGRLMPHLHLPAQSGSDAVLRRMARRNSVAEFEALAAAARTRIPGLTITTDLIAGFPGESTADFEATLAFARRGGFAHLHVFPYSARAGTAAARFGGQLPRAERSRRSHLLNELDVELRREVRRGMLGTAQRVLWESAQPWPQAAGYVRWEGLSGNYLRVQRLAPDGVDLHNQIETVRLNRLDGDLLWAD